MSLKNRFLFLPIIWIALFPTMGVAQTASVRVSPQITKSIKGISELDRKKYINLASTPDDLSKNLNSERFNRYIHELEITLGRKLYVVRAESAWGNGYREDATRPGWMDTTYYKNTKNPNDIGLNDYRNVWGNNAGIAAHDGHNAYPAFMPGYSYDGANDEFPVNNDAAAEMAAFTLKYGYSDFQRPQYFELVNEPHWKFWSDQRFIDHHIKTKKKFDEMNIPTEVGGPCLSVGYFYKKKFGSLNQITDFIDATNNQLDFYSFHIYDYMKWSDTENDFIGSVSTGLPEEAVFDAIAAHTYNKYGKEFTFVGSEHGGYISDSDNRKYAENKLAGQYFPGSGFAHEMEKRSISNFVMVNSALANTLTFMNHPHVVKKSVPFILLQSASWDPYYYSSLLVKENFDKNSTVWHEAKLMYYYDFFKDVRGRRVEAVCDDPDIQHLALADENTLILIFHNQSNSSENLELNIGTAGSEITGIKIRRLGRGNDFRPYLNEETLAGLDGLTLEGQESVAIFIHYENKIKQKEKYDYTPYYSHDISTQFSGTRYFSVNVDEPSKVVAAELRIGIGRDAGAGKQMDVWFNNVALNIPVENCADRITSDTDYGSLRSIQLDPGLVKSNNTIKITFPDGKEAGVGAVVIRAAKVVEGEVTTSNQIKSSKINVFPNPASNKVNIQSENPGEMFFFDISGKLLFHKKLVYGINEFELSAFQPGQYIVRIQTAKQVKSDKLCILN